MSTTSIPNASDFMATAPSRLGAPAVSNRPILRGSGSARPELFNRRFLESQPSPQLAVAAQAGDSEAAGELYRRTRSRARQAALAFCHDADADDAVSEGLTKALRRIGQLRDPAAVESWLVRCVIRAAVDLSRQRHRQPPTDAVESLTENAVRAGESAAEGAMAVLEGDAIAQAVRELRPDLRVLLYLRYEAHLSVQHIATALGKPAGTIRRQCVEARRMAGKHFLCHQLRPGVGECARVTDVLCQQHYRRPGTRVGRRTTEHLRRCRACRDRQSEVAAVLTEMGFRKGPR
jgi:RNA polymerase sigma-70 factor (ECF subfamily)